MKLAQITKELGTGDRIFRSVADDAGVLDAVQQQTGRKRRRHKRNADWQINRFPWRVCNQNRAERRAVCDRLPDGIQEHTQTACRDNHRRAAYNRQQFTQIRHRLKAQRQGAEFAHQHVTNIHQNQRIIFHDNKFRQWQAIVHRGPPRHPHDVDYIQSASSAHHDSDAGLTDDVPAHGSGFAGVVSTISSAGASGNSSNGDAPSGVSTP